MTRDGEKVFAALILHGIHPVTAAALLGLKSPTAGRNLMRYAGLTAAPPEALLPLLPRELRAGVQRVRAEVESEKIMREKKQELLRQEAMKKLATRTYVSGKRK